MRAVWYWWKLKQAAKLKGVLARGEWRQREAFKRNLTTLIEQFRAAITPDASLIALHTSVLPACCHPSNTSACADLEQVAFGNAAIRSLAHEKQLGLMDWDSMVHLGWPRELILFDDVHPRRSVNTYFAQLWLHALAVL